MDTKEPKIGLILTGGGARAAYQVGVLNGIRKILLEAGWPEDKNPFQIICGTSAGAINGAALACRADHFSEGVRELVQVWAHFSVDQVYRVDVPGIAKSGARWLMMLTMGWLLRHLRDTQPVSLLDNTPLVGMLHRLIDLPRLDRILESDALTALALTASSYSSGKNLTFYQASRDILPWRRAQRAAVHDQIGIDHLLASAAIPFIFPAIPMFYEGRREYFGDGAMRQIAPISPAIHLGAEKVLVIGAARLQGKEDEVGEQFAPYPSVAQIAGHAMSSIFLDSLAADIERTNRINKTLAVMTPEQLADTHLRPIETLVIAPSEPISTIARQHVRNLPKTVRMMLGGIGGTDKGGSTLASYLLFERSFTRELIRLGEADTQAMAQEVRAFFGLDAKKIP